MAPVKSRAAAGRFQKGQSGNPAGRKRGVPNKATREVKAWAQELFESEEWRASATERIISGKAPHLESHALAVLMPKPKDGGSLTKDGDTWVFRWAVD